MIDDARKVPSNTDLVCDVCVIGAGAAGITLSIELAEAGLDVILLEAGGLNKSGKSQELYRGHVVDTDRHLPLDSDRYRQLGGTTSLWGGRCLPFDDIDFEKRDYVPHSGWPITRKELDPYYQKAHWYCECGDFTYFSEEALTGAPSDMISGFKDGYLVTRTIERWSSPTNFGKHYQNTLKSAAKARVFLHAICKDIETNEAGDHIHRLVVSSFKKNPFYVKPRSVILAGGGLEVTRLLLASNSRHKNGIGNHSDWLGRGYMCHFSGTVAQVKFQPNAKVISGYEVDNDNVYCRRRFWISEEAQRRYKILNTFMLLDRPLLGDPSHGSGMLSLAFLAKLLIGKSKNTSTVHGKYGLYWRHIKNILAGSPEIMMVLPKWSRSRFLQGRRIPSLLATTDDNSYHLFYQTEQTPNPDSRVSLGTELDFFAMPRLNVDYRVAESDIDSVYRAHQIVDQELRGQNCGSLSYLSDDPKAIIRSHMATLGHHIGTTRMAVDPSKGVVDQNLKVHGLSNLYIASSSTFPTCSQANPTLTIVALAIRLAQHLGNLRK